MFKLSASSTIASFNPAAHARSARTGAPRTRWMRGVRAGLRAGLCAGLTVAGLSACSTTIDGPGSTFGPTDEPAPQPLPVSFVYPSEGAVLSMADDVDAAVPGLQVAVVVEVNDASVDAVQLVTPDGARLSSAVVLSADDRLVARFEAVTVATPSAGRAPEEAHLVAELEERARARRAVTVVPPGVTVPDACTRGLTTIVGDVELHSAAALDAFYADDCVHITGDVVLTGTKARAVDALRGVLAIGGALRITGNSALADLDGLRDLRVLGGALHIAENPALAPKRAHALHAQLVRAGYQGSATLPAE